jgi:hypothetical protein
LLLLTCPLPGEREGKEQIKTTKKHLEIDHKIAQDLALEHVAARGHCIKHKLDGQLG